MVVNNESFNKIYIFVIACVNPKLNNDGFEQKTPMFIN